MATWRQIIENAQNLLAISGVTAPPSDADTNRMLLLLRGIILDLQAKNLELAEEAIEIGNIQLTMNNMDVESGIEDGKVLAVEARLALFSAPIFEITPSKDLEHLSRFTYNSLFPTLPPTKLQNPFQPTGQGDRYYNDRPRFMVNRFFGYDNFHTE